MRTVIKNKQSWVNHYTVNVPLGLYNALKSKDIRVNETRRISYVSLISSIEQLNDDKHTLMEITDIL